MSTRDLIEGEALLDDEDNEEEFDEETGEPVRGPSAGEPNTYDDSSEEDDEEEEDEEAARAVRPPPCPSIGNYKMLYLMLI